ncbi:ABC transporter substrate-binding protein [Prosthecomicrobium pneumaticum]|uniref:Multiple sugar transport system substrate-binding protein n=1 Tax=Prosthecomicrobium pneumaticum TaxID=81895 RepID=A0A7W9CTM4_9HYPH|nr:sugar ABC transporter substrate-binding protein [Prosthecomicrobium pneumaticum]MBB5751414.1 multiple sugar transport system substrate-binding protein [Prosthecomicrobium pneumaticum]
MVGTVFTGVRGVDRRRILKAAAAGLAMPYVARLGVGSAFAQDKAFAGQEVSLLIIQPHVVTGQKLAADFEAATGAKVKVTVVPYDQVQAKATLDVQSGANEFDVLDYWYPTVGQLADEGTLEDVTDLIERDKAAIQPDDYIPLIYDAYTLHGGRRYGLPYDGDSHLLFYNKEILDRNGLKPPATWADYEAAIKTITEAESKNGIYGAAVLGGKAPIIIGSSYANRLAGFGGAFLKEDGSSALDSEAAVAAAKALLDSAPYALPTPLETRFEEGLPAFLGGKVAFIEFWSDLGVYAQDPSGSKIVDKWGAVRVPVGGSNTTPRLALNAGFAFGISSGSQKKELAWELIKFATKASYQKELLLLTGSGIDPDRTSLLYSEEYKAFAPAVQAGLAGGLEQALAWPTTAVSPQLQQTLADELALVLAGSKTPEQAIADAHTAWTGIIAG